MHRTLKIEAQPFVVNGKVLEDFSRIGVKFFKGDFSLEGELLLDVFPDLLGGEALLAKGAEGEGVVAFGEAFARGVEQKRVVPVLGGGELEPVLEGEVDVGGGEEIFAA